MPIIEKRNVDRLVNEIVLQSNSMTQLAISPNGELLAVMDITTERKLIIYQLSDWAIHKTIDVTDKTPDNIRFIIEWSPESEKIAIVSNEVNHDVHIIDLESERVQSLSGHEGVILALAWSPEGTKLIGGGDEGRLYKWDVGLGEIIQSADVLSTNPERPGVTITHIDWNPLGTTLAIAVSLGYYVPNGTIQIWEAKGLEKLFHIDPNTKPMKSLAWSPDGQILAAVSEWYVLITVDSATQMYNQWVPEGMYDVDAFSWATDSSWLALTSSNGELVIADLNDRVILAAYDDNLGDFAQERLTPFKILWTEKKILYTFDTRYEAYVQEWYVQND